MAAKTNLIFLFLMAQNTLIFGQITSQKIDSTLLPLALSITQNRANDSDKIVAIYQWMSAHLEYDFESVINERKGIPMPDSFQQPAIAIRRKRAVCDGYSRIFRDFCQLNGVFATSIIGYTSFNDLTDSAQVLHAWNAVKVNNNWYLMDVTWEDAEFDFQQKRTTLLADATKKIKFSPHENLLKHIAKKRSHRLVDNLKLTGKNAEKIATAILSGFVDSTALNAPDTAAETDKSPIFAPPAASYLFVSPQVFRTDHLPKDPLWQLTDSVVSLQKFFFQQDPSVSPYFSTHFDHKNRLLELPKLDFLEQERRELSRQLQYNPHDWMVIQNIACDYTKRVYQAFQHFNILTRSDAPKLIELQQILTNAALDLSQAEGFHRMAGKISTRYAAVNMVENLAACEGYRQHIEQLWEWLKK
jgi:hypothetical protein